MSWTTIQKLKDLHRQSARSRPFEEKIELLERLRDRSRALAQLRPRPTTDWTGEVTVVSVVSASDQRSAAWGTLQTWRLGAAPWLLTASAAHLRSIPVETDSADVQPAIWSVSSFGT